MFHDCCPNCKHEWNPDIIIKAGTKLELMEGFGRNYIVIVHESNGAITHKPIVSYVTLIWDKAKELSK